MTALQHFLDALVALRWVFVVAGFLFLTVLLALTARALTDARADAAKAMRWATELGVENKALRRRAWLLELAADRPRRGHLVALRPRQEARR